MNLTPRELDILVAVASGAKYAEVARVCGIKVQTVKDHMASARARYDAGTNTELFAILGWLRVPGEYRKPY